MKNKKKVDPKNKSKGGRAVWDFESDEQREAMLEEITPENCGEKIKLIREISGISRRELANILGCSESTITRIERVETEPTKKFIFLLGALVAIGHARFSKMPDAEKEKLSEVLGASGGVLAGVGGSIGAISTSGVVTGLSGAGITSGLAALGGGTMLGGLAVVATVPVAVGVAGFGLVKGIKAICKANRLSCTELNGEYEIAHKLKKTNKKKK